MKNSAPYLLLVLGLLQPIGYLSGIVPIRGIGLATVASPLPLVFSHFRGYETFAGSYEAEIFFDDGSVEKLPITPALYGKLAGPYNRRNTYGAVISYGPALTEEKEKKLVDNVLRFGFCHEGPLAQEFVPNRSIAKVIIHIKSNTAGRENEAWQLGVDCHA